MQLHYRKKCTIYSILGVYMHFLAGGGAYINELGVMRNIDLVLSKSMLYFIKES